MFQLFDLVKRFITCIQIFWTINGQEFVVMPNRKYEEPVSRAHINSNLYFTPLSSESVKVIPTYESEQQSYTIHSDKKSDIVRPLTGAERHIAHKPLDVFSSSSLFDGQRRVQENNNNRFEVQLKLVMKNPVDSGDLLENEFFKNDMKIDKSASVQNCLKHIHENFDTPRSRTAEPDNSSHRLTGNTPAIANRPVSPPILKDHSALTEKNNDVFEGSNKPVLSNCVNSTDILSQESLTNNKTLNNVSSATAKNVTVDDRASFDGDKCPTGLVRVLGRCIPQH